MTEFERRRFFDELYTQYEKRVFAYCVYVTGDRDQAKDVFQEVFIKAYQALHSLRDREKLSNWLFRIARNECLNSMKSTQRSQKRKISLEYSEHLLHTPKDAASYNDEYAHLHWGIGQLSKEYREALVLAEFEGFSLKEIAELTGASLSNVKVRIHRAKMKLHTLLQPILNDHE